MSERKNITRGSFRGVDFHIEIPTTERGHGVSSREITTERRLQITKRPLKDGSPVRDFGGDSRVFSAEIHFFGPNYVEDFAKFETILNEGKPGTLILPDHPAVSAYFWKMTDKAGVEDGKIVSVSWVEDSTTTPGEGLVTAAKTPGENKGLIDSATAALGSALKNNPFLAAVRGVESGLSTVRKSVNTVLALEEGVRNRIIQVQANITGTIDLVKQGIDQITSFRIDLFPQKAKTSRQLGTDPETGQKIADFSSPDTAPAIVDPLAKPSAAPVLGAELRNLDSDSGAELFITKLIDSIKADRDTLVADSAGKADDVAAGMTALSNSLGAFLTSLKIANRRQVIVPSEMSLMEVMFQNGVSLDELEAVHSKNLSIDDILVIPAGTLVTL
jgi:hypothetical protein